MKKKNSNTTNITLSLNNDYLNLLNQLCELENRKRGNQIIRIMKYYIKKNNLKI